MTVYHLYGPAKALPTIIDYEADRFQHLDYSEEQFKTEAGAILGEYAKSASNPEQMLDEKIAETAYTKHTYRHTVIGYLDDVKAMPSGFAYSREFFRRYYTPDNATVIVVGDFDKKETLAHLDQGLRRRGRASSTPPRSPSSRRRRAPRTRARRLEVADAAAPVPRLAHARRQRSRRRPRCRRCSTPTSSARRARCIRTWSSAASSSTPSSRPGSASRDPSLFGVVVRVKKASDVDTVEQGDPRRDRQARRAAPSTRRASTRCART